MIMTKKKSTKESSSGEKVIPDKLRILEGEDWNSDDDEDEDEDEDQAETKHISTTATATKKASRKTTGKHDTKLGLDSSSPSTVIYIGHLPALFGEKELWRFLKQFGPIIAITVSRSKKTNNSRGYAFCRFKSSETAAIVASTLAGYLLFDSKQHVHKRLVCHVVPADKIHPRLFTNPKKKKQASKSVEPKRTMEAAQIATENLVALENRKRLKLQAAGIDYTFPGYAAGVVTSKDDQGQAEKQAGKVANKDGPKSTIDSVMMEITTDPSTEVSNQKKRNDKKAETSIPATKSPAPINKKKRKSEEQVPKAGQVENENTSKSSKGSVMKGSTTGLSKEASSQMQRNDKKAETSIPDSKSPASISKKKRKSEEHTLKAGKVENKDVSKSTKDSVMRENTTDLSKEASNQKKHNSKKAETSIPGAKSPALISKKKRKSEEQPSTAGKVANEDTPKSTKDSVMKESTTDPSKEESSQKKRNDKKAKTSIPAAKSPASISKEKHMGEEQTPDKITAKPAKSSSTQKESNNELANNASLDTTTKSNNDKTANGNKVRKLSDAGRTTTTQSERKRKNKNKNKKRNASM